MSPIRLSTLLWSLTCLLALAWPAAPARAEAPRVVASIKPIHSLVAGVMAGVGTPELLVKGAGSPHTYSLRPSEARALRDAQVVFWVGPALESFLARPLEALSGDARVVMLSTTPGLLRLPTRAGGPWEPDADAHAGGHPDQYDPHVWLDPRNAEVLAERIAAVLAAADPPNAARYRSNVQGLVRRLRALDTELHAALAPVASVPFVVFHDAYHYLERRYGLHSVGAVTVNPEQRPGARRIIEIRDRLRSLSAACVFSEPEFQPRVVQTIVEGTHVRTGVLDPLGADLPAGPPLYFTLMRRMGASLVRCLGPAQR